MSIRSFSRNDPNYDTLKYLGKGSFGTVTKVQRKTDGKVLACKSIQTTKQPIEFIQREVAVLRALVGCRNVVQWTEDISYDVTRNEIHLHMAYYPQGNLADAIRSGIVSSKDTVTQIFCGLAMALFDCHSKGIVHRDIKPANILLSKGPWNGQEVTIAHLADFGLGKYSFAAQAPGSGMLGTTMLGTREYMAPESLVPSNPTYGQKSDIFSLGCVMYEVCTRRLAYNSPSRMAVPELTPAAALTYGGRLTTLVHACMALWPAARISTPELLQALEYYCITHWQNELAKNMWTSIAAASADAGGYGYGYGYGVGYLPMWY